MKHRTASLHRLAGFTLVELLIVIGIIAILISILIPAVNAVRVKAQTANTQNMLSRLESAIQAYYGDHSAYPGPVTHGQLSPYTTADLDVSGTVVYLDDTGTNRVGPITSTENLYLGLTVGLTVNMSTPRVYYNQKAAENPDGGSTLNSLKLRRIPAYLKVDKSETTYQNRSLMHPTNPTGQWGAAGAGGLVGDSQIPEYLDKYNNPMPIVYMRAQKGANGKPGAGPVIARFLDLNDGNFNTAPDPAVYPCQYDPEMIQKTYANRNDKVWPEDVPEYERTFPVEGVLLAGDEAYFGNAALSTAARKEPAKRDEYMLISAGPDGKYGTKDDITNFR